MSHATGLKCRECGEEYPKEPLHACRRCFAPLETVYDYEEIAEAVSRDSIGGGPNSLWRYREFLPVEDPDSAVDIGAGFTPLLDAGVLAERLGLQDLHVKNDSVNPSFSFKDRPASVAITKALEFDAPAVGCASTGNLSGAVASHAAKAELPSFILVPEGLELSKITQTVTYGSEVIEVEGTYDDANRLATEVAASSNIALANVDVRPFYVEGSKTLAFEVCEQLGWRAPDHIIVPVASGALLHAVWRGLKELEKVGLIDGFDTKITAAQAGGCAPITEALLSGEEIKPVEKPDTIAKSLAIGDPADGHYAMEAIRNTGGTGRAPGDDEILEGIKLLASTEGIYTEPAGGTVVATLKTLVEDGKIDEDEETVLLVTGNGLKTQKTISKTLSDTHRVEASLEKFKNLINRIGATGIEWS
ncbi:threonine synthase [candidate division MSBL1 archaeon SCGC-AAA259O05]|uniref:Threonine synthase n=1 Tax=candidate division MSBL1 archaeon SCGC-AAA259O05 TaxID=1698271 RepID=A0A133V5L9_9EURY|nr:threonine synthase [candidate division MSBL1 archaeon SCGC-AAA259O05]